MADEAANAEVKKEQKETKEAAKPQQQPPRQPRHSPQHEPHREAKKATSIIRMGGADIDGSLNIERALAKIKGIGSNFSHSLSHAVETKLGIPKSTALGALSEEQVESINNIIKEPLKYDIPKYLLNRRKDMETGKELHMVGSDLTFAVRQDVSRDVSLRLWRGYRHQHGQKVRGQRTRSTGRTGATVGVMKKAAKAQMAATQQEKGKEAPKK